MDFASKTVIVTGGAQGIGRACVGAFAQAGARVVIADLATSDGEKTAKHVGKTAGAKISFVPCDVGNKDSVQAVIAHAVENFGSVDVLVNNAGIIHTDEFLDLAEEDFDRVLRVNLKGAFLMSQAAAKQMVAQGNGGAIINMSSVNGVLAIANQIPYVTSKGGLNQLTKVMALSLAKHGIRVNGIGPGSILTDMLKTVMNDEAARQKILSRTPMGRCGEPEEIAQVAVFLASEHASYITGQTVYADGGRMGLNYTVPVEN